LIKEGWTITDDPLVLEFGVNDIYIDLAAEKLSEAEREGQRIAVEVKSSLGTSMAYEFHMALGQFLNDRMVLDDKDSKRVLYLAVPECAHSSFFVLLLAQTAVKRHNVNLIVYDPESEAILQWIK